MTILSLKRDILALIFTKLVRPLCVEDTRYLFTLNKVCRTFRHALEQTYKLLWKDHVDDIKMPGGVRFAYTSFVYKLQRYTSENETTTLFAQLGQVVRSDYVKACQYYVQRLSKMTKVDDFEYSMCLAIALDKGSVNCVKYMVYNKPSNIKLRYGYMAEHLFHLDDSVLEYILSIQTMDQETLYRLYEKAKEKNNTKIVTLLQPLLHS